MSTHGKKYNKIILTIIFIEKEKMPKQKITADAIFKLQKWKRSGVTVSEIIKMNLKCLRGVSKTTIYRYAVSGSGEQKSRGSGQPLGRKPKVTEHDKRQIKKAISKLRRTSLSFTVAALQREAGLGHLELSTVRKHMNKLGYGSFVARKKGILSEADKSNRYSWAKDHQSMTKVDWRTDVDVWTDIVGIEFKVIRGLGGV